MTITIDMEDRVIDISDAPAALHVRLDQLIIEQGETQAQVPLCDLTALIVSHPQVSFTLAVINGICEKGGVFIICDGRRQPSAMMLPLVGHCEQTQIMAAQLLISEPLKKQIWKQVIQGKIKAQAETLFALREKDCGLEALAQKVSSGDSNNCEAQASRIYWPALFGDGFRRRPLSDDIINVALNYGYALVRAITARGLCAAGLNLTLGIHHHNKYNPFCLADDLMEPFRPLVDKAVFNMRHDHQKEMKLDKVVKGYLIEEIFDERLFWKEESRSLKESVFICTSSLAGIIMKKGGRLAIPAK